METVNHEHVLAHSCIPRVFSGFLGSNASSRAFVYEMLSRAFNQTSHKSLINPLDPSKALTSNVPGAALLRGISLHGTQ